MQRGKEETLIGINGKTKKGNEIDFLCHVQSPADVTSFFLGCFWNMIDNYINFYMFVTTKTNPEYLGSILK